MKEGYWKDHIEPAVREIESGVSPDELWQWLQKRNASITDFRHLVIKYSDAHGNNSNSTDGGEKEEKHEPEPADKDEEKHEDKEHDKDETEPNDKEEHHEDKEHKDEDKEEHHEDEDEKEFNPDFKKG